MKPRPILPNSLSSEDIEARMRDLEMQFAPGGLGECEAQDMVAEYMGLENELERLKSFDM